MTTVTILSILIVVIFLVFLFLYFDLSSKNEELLNRISQLEQDNKVLEAETLKFSLQPHTLRNIFAQFHVISQKLTVGIDALTDSLEYLFDKGKNHFVSIKEEVEFIEQYLKLNSLFLNEIDAITIDRKEVDRNVIEDKSKQIPHLITAYFLENAFKHGNKKHPEFLRVKIIAKNQLFEIHVINKLKPSTQVRKTTGIGLDNMKKRLNLFTPNKFEIKNSCNEEEYHSILKIQLT